MRKFLLTASCAFLLAGPAWAAPDKYSFDKDHTHILFSISHEGFSSMWGRIKEFDGYFTFDEKEPEKSEVDVTLNPASVDTDVPALNKALQGEKFFDVEHFPAMHFKSTKVWRDAKAKNAGYVMGDLTLLDVTKPVTMHVTYNKSGIHPFTNNYVSGFSAETRFKRSDFGMKAYPGDVGDEVSVHIEAEGTDPLKHPGNAKTPH